MLENLENLIRENAQGAIVNNTDIPNEKNDAAIAAASSSITEVLKKKISGGDVNGLINAFKDPSTQRATSSEVEGTYTNKLQGLGINLDSAKSIAASLIPVILAKFTQKTNDPNDTSFNFQDIVRQISGPDGKFQLSDLTNLFNKGGASSEPNAEKDAGDGLLDKLKGLF